MIQDAMRSNISHKTYLAVIVLLPGIWLAAIGWQTERIFATGQVVGLAKFFSGLGLRGQIGLATLMAAWLLVLLAVRVRRNYLLPYAWLASLSGICVAIAFPSQLQLAVLTLAWLGIIAWLLGLATLTALGVSLESLERLILPAVVGYGILAMIVFALGLMGLLNAPWILALTILLVPILGWRLRSLCRTWATEFVSNWRNVAPMPWASFFCYTLLTLFVIANWIGALAPETGFDALMSHLALAKTFATEHRVLASPYLLSSYWPMNGEMLYTLGYLLGGEPAAKLLHFSAGLLAAGLVYVVGRQLDSHLTGVLAATIFYTTPIIAWESTTANIDLFAAAYVTAAMVLFVKWARSPWPWGGATAIGLCLGFAMGIKPTSGYIALATGLLLLYQVYRAPREQKRTALLFVASITVVTTLVGGIWYYRSLLLTGNPIFPFLNGIFQSPMWYPRNENFNYGIFGIGVTPAALITLPWSLTFEAERFGESPAEPIGMLYLAMVPLFFLMPQRMRRIGGIGFLALVFWLIWSFSVQYVRYLIPAMPLLAVIAAGALQALVDEFRVRVRGLAWMPTCAFGGLALLTVPLMLNQFRYTIPTLVPYDVVLGRISREQYLDALIPGYRAYTYVNSHLGGNDRIYSMGEESLYLSDVPIVRPFWSVAGNEILYAPDEKTVLERLAASQITYLLVNQTRIAAGKWHFVAHSQPFLAQNAVLEFSWNNVFVYRLAPGAASMPEAQNRLQNASFEEAGADESPAEWFGYGNGIVDRTGTRSHSGQVAVQADATGGFFQFVHITPDHMYTLGHWTRADGSNQFARLQINWLDRKGNMVDVSIQVVAATTSWEWHQFSVTAPQGAVMAQVYASVHENSEVWFDDVSLTEQSR